MRIKDIDKAELEFQPLQRLKQRAKKHDVKVAKSTEQMVEALADQNEKLSATNLKLTKMVRALYRSLPDNLKAEYERIKAEIDAE